MTAFINHISIFLASQTTAAYFIRVLIATLCGVLIGLERTKRSKEAGIRTHCIIASASALIMIISKYGFTDLADAAGNMFAGSRGADAARVAAQVVSGISFLGAGVIFKKDKDKTVSGLTTAAGIWATVAVGLACGCGMYKIAVMVTVLILIIQLVLHRLNVGNDAYTAYDIRIVMENTPKIREVLIQKQQQLGMIVTNSNITIHEDGLMEMQLNVRMKKAIPLTDAAEFIDEHPEIKSLSV